MTPLEIASMAFMIAGGLVFLGGALGLLRLRDFYARLSGVTICGGLAPALILLGLFLDYPTWENAWKIVLALLIQLSTAAIGGNALVRAGYLTGTAPTESTAFDDLEEAGERRSGEDGKA
ncbi:cation:proton antiporter [Nocardiopsis salina]|uniref:cation:proton antiporter n=1 Tax=Nocardiopsis salina TaxID=245836 RepID=UPI00034C2333|nr:monovalent cation/H(+) antiporter subunit G [Nocardiopsis salina]